MSIRIRLTDRNRLCLLCYVRPGSPAWRALTLSAVSASLDADGAPSELFLFCDSTTAAELKNLARIYCPSAFLAIEREASETA